MTICVCSRSKHGIWSCMRHCCHHCSSLEFTSMHLTASSGVGEVGGWVGGSVLVTANKILPLNFCTGSCLLMHTHTKTHPSNHTPFAASPQNLPITEQLSPDTTWPQAIQELCTFATPHVPMKHYGNASKQASKQMDNHAIAYNT